MTNTEVNVMSEEIEKIKKELNGIWVELQNLKERFEVVGMFWNFSFEEIRKCIEILYTNQKQLLKMVLSNMGEELDI
jgi:hypothetical protein